MWSVVSSAKVRFPSTYMPHPQMATKVELLPSEQNSILMHLKLLHFCLFRHFSGEATEQQCAPRWAEGQGKDKQSPHLLHAWSKPHRYWGW